MLIDSLAYIFFFTKSIQDPFYPHADSAPPPSPCTSSCHHPSLALSVSLSLMQRAVGFYNYNFYNTLSFEGEVGGRFRLSPISLIFCPTWSEVSCSLLQRWVSCVLPDTSAYGLSVVENMQINSIPLGSIPVNYNPRNTSNQTKHNNQTFS